MKNCPYCGKEYPDDATVCAVDGELLPDDAPAVDEHTVQFDLCYPDGSFLAKIAFTSFQIQDTDYLQKAMANHILLAKPVGTGPYMLDRWVRGDSMTLVTNPAYTGPNKPKVDKVVVKWSAEAASRLTDLQASAEEGAGSPVSRRRADAPRSKSRRAQRVRRATVSH